MENQEKKQQTDAAIKNEPVPKGKKTAAYYMLFEMGTEFALILALPLLVFIYLGKWADAKTSQHFFVIIGIVLGLAISWYMIFAKIRDLKKFLDK